MVVIIQGLEVLGDWAGGDYSLRYPFFLINKYSVPIFWQIIRILLKSQAIKNPVCLTGFF